MTTPIEHTCEIIEMDLNQVEMASERKICMIDSNRDMFISKCSGPPCQLLRYDGAGVYTNISAIAGIDES